MRCCRSGRKIAVDALWRLTPETAPAFRSGTCRPLGTVAGGSAAARERPRPWRTGARHPHADRARRKLPHAIRTRAVFRSRRHANCSTGSWAHGHHRGLRIAREAAAPWPEVIAACQHRDGSAARSGDSFCRGRSELYDARVQSERAVDGESVSARTSAHGRRRATSSPTNQGSVLIFDRPGVLQP